jgi:hypothetical protein
LKVRVGADSAIFGPLLKTSCSPDEVCLSDSVSEAGEKYPNQQFELEVEPVQPPKLKIGKSIFLDLIVYYFCILFFRLMKLIK